MAPEPSGKKENLSEAGKKEGAHYKRSGSVYLYVCSNGDRISSENFSFWTCDSYLHVLDCVVL